MSDRTDRRGAKRPAEERDRRSAVPRRAFLGRLLSTSGVVVAAGCGKALDPTPTSGVAPATQEAVATPAGPATPPPPQLPDGLKAAHFVVHNRSPLALETRRSEMGRSVITPLSRFFVRNNLPRPDVSIVASPDAWKLEVRGVVRPKTLTLAELKGLGLDTDTTVLQCSGNGREFYEHGPSGSQWATGAAGCAMWTGVRVSTLVAHLGGPVAGARFLTSTGGEELPKDVERDLVVVERSIPLAKGLSDCLLAWEMNGQPLPISHGGPLRLVVPGYFGCNNIKYVKTIAATAVESTAKIQATGYRLRPIGQKGAPTQPPMWRMPVKSWLNGPGADGQVTLAGDVVFHGVALAGERGVAKVEVSLDQGGSWHPATLHEPDMGPNAWRLFSYRAKLAPGTHTVVTRATDTQGDVQPKERVANERGYGNNAWLDHALTVKVVADVQQVIASTTRAADAGGKVHAPAAARRPVKLSAAGQRGKQVLAEVAEPACGACHTLADAGTKGAVGPNLDALHPGVKRVEAALRNGVGAMPSYGGKLSEAQIKDLAAYIAEATR